MMNHLSIINQQRILVIIKVDKRIIIFNRIVLNHITLIMSRIAKRRFKINLLMEEDLLVFKLEAKKEEIAEEKYK